MLINQEIWLNQLLLNNVLLVIQTANILSFIKLAIFAIIKNDVTLFCYNLKLHNFYLLFIHKIVQLSKISHY